MLNVSKMSEKRIITRTRVTSKSPDNLPIMDQNEQKKTCVSVKTQKGDVKVSIADLVEIC